MATRTITTRLALDGEKEFKQEMASVNSNLRTLAAEMKKVEAEFSGQEDSVEALTRKQKLYREEIAQQEIKIKALAQAVIDAEHAYGKTDKRTDDFRRSLINAQTDLIKLQRELKDTDDRLDGVGREAKDAGDALGDMGRKSDGAAKSLDDLVSDLGKLKNAVVGGAIAKGAQEIVGAVLDIEESTREYRQIMGTLEVSSQAAGYSAEQTAETYNLLYSVLGDTQTAATATANLQALGLSQERLIEITNMAIGAWASYGDSIPIDGLTQAISETINVGRATGNFADILNFAGLSEDEFNEKLTAMEDKSLRANYVLGVLSAEGLDDVSTAWQEVNSDIVAANESQANLERAMGELGDALSPVANKIRDFGADAIEWLADRVRDALDAWNEFWGALTSGDMDNATNQRRAAQRGYTPDAVTAETAWTNHASRSLPSTQPAASATDVQTAAAGAANAIMATQNTPSVTVNAVWTVNGKEFYADTLEDLRAVESSNPEVRND